MSQNPLRKCPWLPELLLLAGFVTASPAMAAPEPAKPTNAVLICIDTVRYDSFMLRNVEDELTPWLDKAQIFTEAMSTAPWTIPSVSSVLTGLYPTEHGAGRFKTPLANLDQQLPTALPGPLTTLPEILAARDFSTGAFVSHPWFNPKYGLVQGFRDFHQRAGWRDDLQVFREWLDQRPPPAQFFGYLHFMEAHDRHTRNPAKIREYLADIPEELQAQLRPTLPAHCAEGKEANRCRQQLTYEVSVQELRGAVAAVLESLREAGRLEDTLVVVFADHGEEFWQRERTGQAHTTDPRKNHGLGHGQSMYQELLHVPLLAWHPGLAGAIHEDPVSLVSVAPTILAWLGVEHPVFPMSGPPLPLERSWYDFSDPPLLFASGIAYGREQLVVRQGADKLIRRLGVRKYEQYDLAADPGELQSLLPDADTAPTGELSAQLDSYRERDPQAALVTVQLGKQQIEELKAIGYLQGVETDGEPPAAADGEDPAAEASGAAEAAGEEGQ